MKYLVVGNTPFNDDEEGFVVRTTVDDNLHVNSTEDYDVIFMEDGTNGYVSKDGEYAYYPITTDIGIITSRRLFGEPLGHPNAGLTFTHRERLEKREHQFTVVNFNRNDPHMELVDEEMLKDLVASVLSDRLEQDSNATQWILRYFVTSDKSTYLRFMDYLAMFNYKHIDINVDGLIGVSSPGVLLSYKHKADNNNKKVFYQPAMIYMHPTKTEMRLDDNTLLSVSVETLNGNVVIHDCPYRELFNLLANPD